MGCLSTIMFSSTLFRVSVYIFLRVAPARILIYPIVASFVVYFINDLRHASRLITTKEKDVFPSSSPGIRKTLQAIILSKSPNHILHKTNLVINIFLILACAEFIGTPYIDAATDVTFTRVGALLPDAAKILVRYPPSHPNVTSNTVHIMWRERNSLSWKEGPTLDLYEERDWVSTCKLTDLWPSTSYEYVLADSNKSILPYPSTPIPFRTFPDPRLPTGSRFKFLSTSCIIPNFPYVPLQGRTIKGFELLADHLTPPSNTSDVSPEFMLFLGDFIYVDVPVLAGSTKEAYRRLYRRNYQSPSFRKIYEKLPIFHAYDDHEILNDFAGNGNDLKAPFPNATDAFSLYAGEGNFDSKDSYYDFRYGDVAFFVMDTRRYRTESYDDLSTRTMLGDTQLAALHVWLARVNNTATFKFIVTSVPFTSLWTHEHVQPAGYADMGKIDTWGGFPTERASLMEAFQSVPNVVLLSGDRHEFAAIESTGVGPHVVREFSTSPLNMFYVPFIKTLMPRTEEVVKKIHRDVLRTENGLDVADIEEEIPLERVVKYIPEGNHKWATLDVDTTDPSKPALKVTAMIDGKSAYTYEMVGSPVLIASSSSALGVYIASGIKDIFGQMGMQPSKWF